MPKISVIVPVYNCEKYIEHGIKSVLGQTYTDWELILVNDGSTDSSGVICRTWEQKDSRIRVLEKENGGGAGEARNRGTQIAEGDFIAYLDSDDYYRPAMLEELVTAQEKHDADVVVAGFEEFVDEESNRFRGRTAYPEQTLSDSEEVRDFFIEHYPEGLLGFPWNKLYRASIIQKYCIEFPKMRRLEDGIFNVLFFERCDRAEIIGTASYCYRASGQVEQGKLPYDFFQIMKVFVNQYYDALDRWGRDIGASEKSMVSYFQNDLVCCLENMLQSCWKKPVREKYKDIERIRRDELTQRMLAKERYAGKYARIALRLFESRHFGRMRVWMRMKAFLKTKCGSIFYRLKEKLNR
ncbi:glycosyltransferase family 2 protein [Hespellia stercorisuis]|uniref:Glycosyl transferase family 2 n=1 Tax=Hespellia stercorisuis DSM 15480 TaxID=1121950 RepID=A0A1M6JXL7_9FIRM|nr:glycosyltransferase family 2 protein [Hespellia stercorisuis]SHJ51446.1 Glycosyl transferase family 2 [Hespellia stercorisuis DSM 15480]